jgi:hypothetical protein
MKQRIAGYLLGTIALALAGGICLAASLLDRRIARTQRDMAAQQYGDPDQVLDTVERYLEYASRLPGIGSGPLNDVRARKAALRYWQRQYNLLIPQQGDPIATIPADNVALQRIVANAVYRSGRAEAKDKTTTLRALDEAINAYLAVLKNVSRDDTAAYNYEYLTRLRDDVNKARREPELTDTTEDGPDGRRGGPPPAAAPPEFKIIVPLEPGELDGGADPGKGSPIERKG